MDSLVEKVQYVLCSKYDLDFWAVANNNKSVGVFFYNQVQDTAID
jgi:hypothetical protein